MLYFWNMIRKIISTFYQTRSPSSTCLDLPYSWDRSKAPGIKQVECSDACKFVARHCAKVISQVKELDFDKSYGTAPHAYSFCINIAIVVIYRLTARVLGVRNDFKIQMFPSKREFVSLHLPIIWTSLRNHIQMYL